MRSKKEKYEKLIQQFDREKDARLQAELKKANKQIDEMIEQAQVIDTFKKHEKLQEVKSQLPQIVTSKDVSDRTQPAQSVEDFAKVFPKGSKVYIESVARDGIVQSHPNGRGEVEVLSQSMRLTVPWQTLKPPRTGQNNTKRILNQSNKRISYTPADSDRVVDIRGLSVEEAIEQLELQLDTAAIQDEDRVKVVHGHGTDKLKRSIRQYLSRSVYVKKWQAGTKLTGGDGVTWIEIN
ncbi:MAG: Smr/MutS family protein [Bdellovibrionales bacterium]